MTIPTNYGLATVLMSSASLPNGAATTLGFHNEAAQTALQCADDFVIAWNARILPQLTDGVTMEGVLVKLGPDSTGPSAISPTSANGGVAETQATPQVSFLVHKNTGLGGRRGRGRMYIPGVSETEVSPAGVIDGARLGTIQTALNNFLSDLTAADLIPVVLHDPGESSMPEPTFITSLTIDSSVATQRRRLRR